LRADDEPLARIVERSDLGEIAIVEQRKLQLAGVDELADGQGARSAVMKSRPAGLTVLPDPRLGDHAAVADQHHTIELEALLELGDLGLQRRGIADIAFEDFDRDRAAHPWLHNSPKTICKLAVLAVTVVPELGPARRCGPRNRSN